jgi:hypothetical protein
LIGGLVKWWAGAYLKIQNCTIYNGYGFGIFSYMLGYSEITSNHIYLCAKNGVHLEAPSGATAVTSTTLTNNSIHTIRGSGATGGNSLYIKNGFYCDSIGGVYEDVVNGITIEGSDNRNLSLTSNHIEQTSGYCLNYLGAGNKVLLIGNIFYIAINNYNLEDTYTLPALASAPAAVSLSLATPKTTLNSIVLTPGTWKVTAAWIGSHSGGTGQLSARQEFALNTAAAIPAYSTGFAMSTVRGDCASSVNTADGFLNGNCVLDITVTANTTLYLYGGAASITNTLAVVCTSWIKATKVGGPY